MPVSDGSEALIFLDGVAAQIHDACLFVAATFRDEETLDGRAAVLFVDGKWASFDIPDDLVSTCFDPVRSQFLALSKEGYVATTDLNNIDISRLPDSGIGGQQFGYVKQITVISNDVYVCGDLCQVYKRTGSTWTHIDAGLLVEDRRSVGRCLNGIAGTSPTSIMAVGDRGMVFSFDGKLWSKVDAPTDASLERVIFVSSDEAYIVGESGVILHGNSVQMELIQNDLTTDRFWGLAQFKDFVYLCSTRSIYRIFDGQLESVDVKMPIDGSFHRLSASSDDLWAIGTNNILKYDGTRWIEIPYPYNK